MKIFALMLTYAALVSSTFAEQSSGKTGLTNGNKASLRGGRNTAEATGCRISLDRICAESVDDSGSSVEISLRYYDIQSASWSHMTNGQFKDLQEDNCLLLGTLLDVPSHGNVLFHMTEEDDFSANDEHDFYLTDLCREWLPTQSVANGSGEFSFFWTKIDNPTPPPTSAPVLTPPSPAPECPKQNPFVSCFAVFEQVNCQGCLYSNRCAAGAAGFPDSMCTDV